MNCEVGLGSLKGRLQFTEFGSLKLLLRFLF